MKMAKFLALCACLSLLTLTASARTIIIDAGHGGFDRGGMPGQRIPEKAYALDVAKRLQSVLRRKGFQTIMTRSGDYFVTLDERRNIANRNPGGVFVSIHFNGAPNFNASGIETYYYSGRESAALAHEIQRRVVAATGSPHRFVRSRGLRVLRGNRLPAVLCELGFLTNSYEARQIGKSYYRQRLAEAVGAAVSARFR